MCRTSLSEPSRVSASLCSKRAANGFLRVHRSSASSSSSACAAVDCGLEGRGGRAFAPPGAARGSRGTHRTPLRHRCRPRPDRPGGLRRAQRNARRGACRTRRTSCTSGRPAPAPRSAGRLRTPGVAVASCSANESAESGGSPSPCVAATITACSSAATSASDIAPSSRGCASKPLARASLASFFARRSAVPVCDA